MSERKPYRLKRSYPQHVGREFEVTGPGIAVGLLNGLEARDLCYRLNVAYQKGVRCGMARDFKWHRLVMESIRRRRDAAKGGGE